MSVTANLAKARSNIIMIVALIVGSIIIVKIEDRLDRDREDRLPQPAASLARAQACEREANATALRDGSHFPDRRHACLILLRDGDASQRRSPDQAAP